MIGSWELLLIAFIVFLLFGGKRLPELARSLGQGIKEFKKASKEIEQDIKSDVSEKPSAEQTKKSQQTSQNI